MKENEIAVSEECIESVMYVTLLILSLMKARVNNDKLWAEKEKKWWKVEVVYWIKNDVWHETVTLLIYIHICQFQH